MHSEYLVSQCGRVHAINCKSNNSSLEVGILCLIAFPESTVRIGNDQHSYLVEVPKELRSGSERVKAFNAFLSILDHEQV
jgi:hypothetical protein